MKSFPAALMIFLFLLVALSWPDAFCDLFTPVVIDNAIPGAYQVAVADINRDGKLDIAALGEGESGVYWYENPSWKRRVICEKGLSRFIDFAFYDLDGDGELECALASGFSLDPAQSEGAISWLDREGDGDRPWTIHAIYREPTTHRLRWADGNGDGKMELIAAPIAGIGSTRPSFEQTPVRLLSFTIPDSPRQDTWPCTVIDDSLHLLHGMIVSRMEGKDAILTASLEGLTMFLWNQEKWDRHSVAAGIQEAGHLTGCSEVAVGQWRTGEKFLATIDPWHGRQVSVYSPFSMESNREIHRTVIDDSYKTGHAIAAGDFDKDGEDEIAAGYRGEGYSLYYYDNSSQNEKVWMRSLLSRDLAVQGLAVADINADGHLDLAASGGQTHNVVLFVNRGVTK